MKAYTIIQFKQDLEELVKNGKLSEDVAKHVLRLAEQLANFMYRAGYDDGYCDCLEEDEDYWEEEW